MTLRINTNIAAQRSARLLGSSNRRLADLLQRLSSGFRIHSAGDDPRGLIVSERLRRQIAGLNQAVANSELAAALVNTAESSLGEVHNLLVRVRQLVLHAGNEGGNDKNAVLADQKKIRNALDSIDRIAKNAQFGSRNLLDGSAGTTGFAQGEGLVFVFANENTRTSAVEGYAVNLTQLATKTRLLTENHLEQKDVNGARLSFFEGEKTAEVVGTATDTLSSLQAKARKSIAVSGLAIDFSILEDGRIEVIHKNYGKGATFLLGVFADQGDFANSKTLIAPVAGQDIAGSIGGEPAVGNGAILKGLVGNANSDGLLVCYLGKKEKTGQFDDVGNESVDQVFETGVVGRVAVINNALTFNLGANAGQSLVVALPNVSTNSLARETGNSSRFNNLGEIDVTLNSQAAFDSLLLVDSAIGELTRRRGDLGALQKNTLQTNLITLRVAMENLQAADSVIRDVDFGAELANFTKERIVFEPGAALSAQANQIPRAVLRLVD